MKALSEFKKYIWYWYIFYFTHEKTEAQQWK